MIHARLGSSKLPALHLKPKNMKVKEKFGPAEAETTANNLFHSDQEPLETGSEKKNPISEFFAMTLVIVLFLLYLAFKKRLLWGFLILGLATMASITSGRIRYGYFLIGFVLLYKAIFRKEEQEEEKEMAPGEERHSNSSIT